MIRYSRADVSICVGYLPGRVKPVVWVETEDGNEVVGVLRDQKSAEVLEKAICRLLNADEGSES